MSKADDDFLKTARERFKLADESDSAQSTREREDLAFYAGEQWPEDLINARKGQNATPTMPAVPARPTLVINKTRQPVRQVQNQERQSDIGVTLVPADDFGDLGVTPDDTEVTLREGLIRRVQREAGAASARTWAAARAFIAGRGYYLVTTKYLPGKTWDQEIVYQRIFNQDGVKLDPAHTEPDGSDAEWGFVSTWTSWDDYASKYPRMADGTTKNSFTDATDGDFMGMVADYPDWYEAKGDGDKKRRYIRITDYYYLERESRELALLADGTSVWSDELSDVAEAVDTRRVVELTMHWCKIGGGIHKLEETTLPSPEMPIIEVVGEELQPFDEQRRVEGMVRPAMGSQRGFNYMVSKLVEMIGLTPISPLIIDPEAIAGFEAWYAQLNTRAFPYAPARTYDDQGRPLKEPHRPLVDANILPVSQAIQMFSESIKDTTGLPDPTLGNVDPTLKSGKAIRETVANAAQSTSNFMDNLARSVRRDGYVVNSYLYAIYGTRQGRLVRIMTGEGDSQRMQIGDPQQQQDQQRMQETAVKVAKLTEDAHFNVAVKVTQRSEIRGEQFTQMMGNIIAADPGQMYVGGDLLYKHMDIPESKELSERAKVMLAPPIQKMLAEKDKGTPMPPAAQAEIAQLQQRIQHAEAAMQEMQGLADKNQADGQVKIQIASQGNQKDVEIERLRGQIEQSKIAADLEKARMDNATKIHVAEIAAHTKGVQMAHEAEHEAAAMAHEAAQSDLDRGMAQASEASGMAHESAEAGLDRDSAQQSEMSGMAHEAAMGAGDQEFQASESALGRLSLEEEEA